MYQIEVIYQKDGVDGGNKHEKKSFTRKEYSNG